MQFQLKHVFGVVMQGFDVVILQNWGCRAREEQAELLRAERAASSVELLRAERQEARYAAWLARWARDDALKRQRDAREAL